MPEELDQTRVQPSSEAIAVSVEPASPGAVGPGAIVGRYVVLAPLGAGAMGVVVMAYDPELDRRVALKLLKPELSRAGLLLKREAQALAKLAHPNVVAVYDVGEHAGQVFVAMEYVEGQVIGRWLGSEPRPGWREILSHYMAAGRGLAAAHAQGLVHRDFKPDNVMVGTDGRVRVMDFGLARGSQRDLIVDNPTPTDLVTGSGSLTELRLTQTGQVTGTPVYMSPEQFRGEATPASDQFGFCVSLYEALYGHHPFYTPGLALRELARTVHRGVPREHPSAHAVPAWIRPHLLRGMAPEPEQRFADIDALLVALTHDPSQRRRVWVAAGIGGAALAGVAALAWPRAPEASDPCAGVAAEIAPAWNDTLRSALVERFEASGLSYAPELAERLDQRLSDYAEGWASERADVCVEHEAGRQSDQLFDLRMGCLAQRRDALAATTELLSEAEASTIGRAVSLVDGLPSLERCHDTEALLADYPPPEGAEAKARAAELRETITRAQVSISAGRYADARAALDALEPELEAFDYPPLLARLESTRAGVHSGEGEWTLALEALERGYLIALEHGMTFLAASNAGRLASARDIREPGPELARHWLRSAEALSAGLDSPNLRRMVFRVRGQLDARASEHDKALANYAAALELIGDPNETGRQREAYACYNNMSASYQHLSRWDEALESAIRAREMLEQRYGPRHPKIALALSNQANTEKRMGRRDEANEHLQLALDIRREAFGPDSSLVADILVRLGINAMDAGESAESRNYYARALEIYVADESVNPKRIGELHHNLGEIQRVEGELELAKTNFERAIELLPETLHGYPLTGLGQLELTQGNPAAALDALERAQAAFEVHPTHPKQRGELYFALARAFEGMGKVKAAREHAERSLEAYREASEDVDEELETVEAWLREQP